MGRADITLRHVTHQCPEDLARTLHPPGLAFEVTGQFDSQLTMLERRLDEALNLRETIDEIRGRTAPDEVRAALYTGLLVMAEIDPWGHNLTKEITAMMQAGDLEIYKISPTLRAAFEEGELKGKQDGEQDLLCEAFAAQAGRAPTSDEQAALAKRTRELGAKQALRALFKLHGDALAAWLLGNGE